MPQTNRVCFIGDSIGQTIIDEYIASPLLGLQLAAASQNISAAHFYDTPPGWLGSCLFMWWDESGHPASDPLHANHGDYGLFKNNIVAADYCVVSMGPNDIDVLIEQPTFTYESLSAAVTDYINFFTALSSTGVGENNVTFPPSHIIYITAPVFGDAWTELNTMYSSFLTLLLPELRALGITVVDLHTDFVNGLNATYSSDGKTPDTGTYEWWKIVKNLIHLQLFPSTASNPAWTFSCDRDFANGAILGSGDTDAVTDVTTLGAAVSGTDVYQVLYYGYGNIIGGVGIFHSIGGSAGTGGDGVMVRLYKPVIDKTKPLTVSFRAKKGTGVNTNQGFDVCEFLIASSTSSPVRTGDTVGMLHYPQDFICVNLRGGSTDYLKISACANGIMAGNNQYNDGDDFTALPQILTTEYHDYVVCIATDGAVTLTVDGTEPARVNEYALRPMSEWNGDVCIYFSCAAVSTDARNYLLIDGTVTITND